MKKTDRPNILWFCTDHQRYDTVNCLGNPHINTPTLNSLVQNGVAFTHTYAQSPICTPSRASMLTGRYPTAHQVIQNGNGWFPNSEKLVTRVLADSGYDCGLAGKFHLSHAYPEEQRPDDGFRVFDWSHHPYPNMKTNSYNDWLIREKNINPHELFADLGTKYSSPGVPTELHQTTWCAEMAIRFITERKETPWLFNINCFDPHPPFDPPAEFFHRYDPETLPHSLFKESDLAHQEAFYSIQQHSPKCGNPRGQGSGESAVSRDQMTVRPPQNYDSRVLLAGYYGMIELIDSQLGRIVEVLKDTNQLENTLILFHSDHGDLMGDHGLMYLGCRFFEGLVRVPLIVSWPSQVQKNLVSPALVELVDIAPTLLEVAGLEPLPSMQGKSLLPILKGEKDPSFHKHYTQCYYNDTLGTTPVPDHSQASMYCDGHYKIVVYHGRNLGELYDLSIDPEEFNDLWDDPQSQRIKNGLILKHFDAVMSTLETNIPRVANF